MALKYITTVFAVVLSANVFAQRISFKNSTMNVGTTLWKKPVTAVFKFTNKEKTPLAIKDVDAGCGCLQPVWTKGQIEKGGEGEISVTYDAALLGRFDRVIDVYTNASESPVRIRMKGRVSTGEKKTLAELFPCRIGDICLSTNSIEFPDAISGDSVTVRLELLNDGQEVYTPQLMHLPPYLTAVSKPAMLARGRRGYIDLTLHTDKLVNMGLNQTSIYLSRYYGDKVGSDNEISVSAIHLPEVHPSENSLLNPKFEVSSTELKLGKLGKKSKLTGRLKITNNGTGVLKLNAVQVFNQALSVSLPHRELVAGESVTMKVSLMAKYLGQSKAQPRVLIITNDANRPKEIITVTFEK